MSNSSARSVLAMLLFLLPFGAAAQTDAIELTVPPANDSVAVTNPVDSIETAAAIYGAFATPRSFALQEGQNDFTLIRDGVPVTGHFASPPSPSQGRMAIPQRRNTDRGQSLCDRYTLFGAGWREPMQLYLGEGAREYLPWIKRAVQAWNSVLGRDIIVLNEDMVNYAYGPHPYESHGFYLDGFSVIYFPTQSKLNAYAMPRVGWNIENQYYEMKEADVFIKKPQFQLTAGRETNLFIGLQHELGHALGLAHITTSMNIMSYDRRVVVRQNLAPFMTLGFFPDYGTHPSIYDWDYFYADSRYSSLIQNLVRPQAQDKAALRCLYDFEDWGQ